MKQHKMMYSIVGVAQAIEPYRVRVYWRYIIRVGLVLCVLSFSGVSYAAPSVSSDPYLVKEYPDGTKVKIRWSQIGRTLDAGVTHGGSPTMRAIQPGEDNIPELAPAPGTQSQKEEVVAPPVQEAAADPVPAPVESKTEVVAPVVSSQEKGSSDVKVLKVYPDGTQVVVSWSQLGATMDQGETHGGPPKIIA